MKLVCVTTALLSVVPRVTAAQDDQYTVAREGSAWRVVKRRTTRVT
jgi:hypothetical protein